ncbi:MAG TPA: aldo/keto reductase [Candidatus Methylacidiphilales bacterium]
MSSFPSPTPASDGVDPSLVPHRLLADGSRIPAIGLGTFGSDSVTGGQVAAAVVGAASVGYRHFDCASVYSNEHLVGEALEAVVKGGVPRSDLWINSKVWNDQHAPAAVAAACRKSLKDLRLDYLDLYFVHWPFPNFHPPGCTVESRSKDARPYLHDKFMETWGAMEKLKEEGLVRQIGTSNMTIPKLKLLLRDARVKPAVNEMELHPHFQQPELFEFVVKSGIIPIGYSPIGSPGRPERDRTPEDTVDVEDPVVVEIARKHGIHPASLCVKWGQQRGQIPIPFSVNRRNYLANIQAVVSAPLSGDEMAALAEIDRNCRLIKGQVFLWKENQSWEDLWDLDGTIAS